MKKLIFLLLLIFLSSLKGTIGQNFEKLFIEEEAGKNQTIIFSKCDPSKIRIAIYSSLRNLEFHSNMVPDSMICVESKPEENLYLICHPRMKFQLMVNGPTYEQALYPIFSLHDSYYLRIKSTTFKGTIHVLTKPNNASLIFREFNNDTRSTAEPITYPTGIYKVTITKPYFAAVDTIITIKTEETTVKFDLLPKFSSIKINVTPQDKKAFIKPFQLWIDSIPIDLKALSDPDFKPASFDDTYSPNKLFDGNIIPLAQAGQHKYKIEAEGYRAEEGVFVTQNSENKELTAVLKPLIGTLSILDDGKAESAQAFINNQFIGTVPFVKTPFNSGEYSVILKKDGYLSVEKEYKIKIKPNQDTVLRVSMEIFKEISFITEPTKAEISVDGDILGLSNDTFAIHALHHTVMIKKSGYATESFNIFIDENTPNGQVIRTQLKENHPLTVLNEGKGKYKLSLQGIDSLSSVYLVDENRMTGKENLLPYGKYKLTLKDGETVVYEGLHVHSAQYRPKIVLPVYSRNSIRALALDFYNRNNFEVSLGMNELFGGAGLTTTIFNLQYLHTEGNTNSEQSTSSKDTLSMLIPNIFFLNWDLRFGGSIFRCLDFCVLGRFKYTPGLKTIDVNIKGYDDASMINYFYGIELSSRLSYFDVNCKIGRQIFDGKCFKYDRASSAYLADAIPVHLSQPVISFGIVVHGPVERANNMIRIWKRPLMEPPLRMLFN